MLGESCEKCELYKSCTTPFMSGFGPENPDILFVGEAPGKSEDEQGRPFVGQSGKLLQSFIDACEFDNSKIRFTNVVRCRPPGNATPTTAQVNYCLDYLLDEIAACYPKVVVLLGATSVNAVLPGKQLSQSQGTGVIAEMEGSKYIAAYHPAYLLRTGVRGAAYDAWVKSFQDIADALYNGAGVVRTEESYTYVYPKTVADLISMRDAILANKNDLIDVDIETIHLDPSYPNNKIVTIALANSTHAWSFPIDHKDAHWTAEERSKLIEILREILTTCKIINHHVKFDCKLIRRLLGIDFTPYGDSIQLSRLLNPDADKHDLKYLAGLYCGMPDYAKELDDYVAINKNCNYDYGGNYGNIPLDLLLPYGAKDVIAAYILHTKLYAKLTPKQRDLYHQMIIPADFALGVIEENGFKIDYDLVERYRAIYAHVMNNVYFKELLKDKHVKKFLEVEIMLESLVKKKLARCEGKAKNGKLYTIPALNIEFAWNDRHAILLQNKSVLKSLNELDDTVKLAKPVKFDLNLASPNQVSELLYTYKKYTPPGYTASGSPSIKRTLLKELVYDMQLEGKTDIFLTNYMHWKLLASILSKTFKSMISTGSDWFTYDGRVRSSYKLGGAKTGRTSSAEPNLQNIPAVEKEPGTILQYLPVKNAFTHTFEHGGLAMFDYSGMELRVMCSIAHIQGMIDVFARKGDVHRYVSSLIYHKPEEEITKFERYRGKWCNWSLLYLGSWVTLYRLYRINGLTKDEAKRVTDMYYAAFPELPKYQQGIVNFVKQNGYVESAFGRILQLPKAMSSAESESSDACRTAVNMPIQGVASDTLMCALAMINMRMREKKCKSMLVNTVHDSLVIDYHPDEREWIVNVVMDAMENVVGYAKDLMPGLDFSWLKVPLVSDVTYGTHYGSYDYYVPPMCDCGTCMAMVRDIAKIGDDKDLSMGYECPSCGATKDYKFKPLLYNNTHPSVLDRRLGDTSDMTCIIRKPKLC